MKRVKFVKFKGELLAIFEGYIKLNGDPRQLGYECYSHEGQHSTISNLALLGSTPATEEEYKTLLEELNQIGYTSLEIL